MRAAVALDAPLGFWVEELAEHVVKSEAWVASARPFAERKATMCASFRGAKGDNIIASLHSNKS